MKKREIVLYLIVSIVCVFLILRAVNTLQMTSYRVSNVASIKTVGVSVWKEQNTTTPLTSINWGVIGAGENKTFICYLKSESNTPSILYLHTENWNPSNASLWIGLTWNLEGKIIDVEQVLEAQLTLTVSPDISNITLFSFEIIINVSE